MNLLIISNMEHYRDADGKIWGWGPTVQEIDHLASLFNKVRHIGCLYQGDPSKSSLPYTEGNIEFVGVPPTGGRSILHKLNILIHAPLYLYTVWRNIGWADVVHVRCPANIPLFAIVFLAFTRKPKKRWIKYAGNWCPGRIDRYSYTFQRWWLKKNFSRAEVTVNGEWEGQPKHIHSFFNPCLTEDDLLEGRGVAKCKHISSPLRLLFVGGLNTSKGVGRAIHVLSLLKKECVDASLDIVGDGPERAEFEKLAYDLDVNERVVFHGFKKRTELAPYYSKAHCMLFPSDSEGWPKVLSEAMAYGVVPVAGSVSSIPQYLKKFGVGRAVVSDELDAYVDVLKGYIASPELWLKESNNGINAADHFGYKRYLLAVKNMLGMSQE